MASEGPRFPATVTTETGPSGDNDWLNAGNVGADDAAEAQITAATYDAGDHSFRLKAQNFGFGIPAGSSINGIIVEIERRAFAGSAEDQEVRLYGAAGTLVGDDKQTATAWPVTVGIATYGSSSDRWNSGLTAADINDPDFGVALIVLATGANTDIGVDFIRITVHYDPPITPPLIQNLGQVFEPTFREAKLVGADFIQQLGQPISPKINLNVHPSLVQQLGFPFDPSVVQRLHPDLLQQLGMVSDPQINQFVHPLLLQQLGLTLDPTIANRQIVIHDLVGQSGAVFDPTVVNRRFVEMPLIGGGGGGDESLLPVFDGGIASFADGGTYQNARDGAAVLGISSSVVQHNVGQRDTPDFFIYYLYFEFDVDAFDGIATLVLKMAGGVTALNFEARLFDFGSTFEEGDWVDSDLLSGLTLLGTGTSDASGLEIELDANLFGSSPLRFIVVGKETTDNVTPTSVNVTVFHSSEATTEANRPTLLVPGDEVEQAFAPTILRLVSPGLVSQLGQLFDPNILFDQSLLLGLISQLGSTFDPSVKMSVHPGLISQLGATFDPQLNQQIQMGLIQQIAQSFSPQINQWVHLGLVQNLGTLFSPTIINTQLVTLDLISQLGQVFSPQLNQQVKAELIQQLGVLFSPQVNLNVHPGLLQNLGAVFSPQLNQWVHPGLISNLGVVLDPTVIVAGSNVHPQVILNLGAVFSPTISVGGVLVTPDVISQLGQVFNPQINQSVSLGLIPSGVQLFDPRVTMTVDVGLISQAHQVFDPTLLETSLVAPGLVSNLGQVFDPSIIGMQIVLLPVITQLGIVFAPAIFSRGTWKWVSAENFAGTKSGNWPSTQDQLIGTKSGNDPITQDGFGQTRRSEGE